MSNKKQHQPVPAAVPVRMTLGRKGCSVCQGHVVQEWDKDGERLRCLQGGHQVDLMIAEVA